MRAVICLFLFWIVLLIGLEVLGDRAARQQFRECDEAGGVMIYKRGGELACVQR